MDRETGRERKREKTEKQRGCFYGFYGHVLERGRDRDREREKKLKSKEVVSLEYMDMKKEERREITEKETFRMKL